MDDIKKLVRNFSPSKREKIEETDLFLIKKERIYLILLSGAKIGDFLLRGAKAKGTKIKWSGN